MWSHVVIRGQLLEPILSFLYVQPSDWTQVINVGLPVPLLAESSYLLTK